MNRIVDYLGRALLVAVVTAAVERVLGLLLPMAGVGEQTTGLVARYLLPLLGALLLALPLAYPVARSRLRGRALWGVVFLAVLGLMTVLTEIEAAVFLTLPPGDLWRGILRSGVAAAVLSWMAVTFYPRLEAAPAPAGHPPNPPTVASWVRRWVGVSFAYLLLYFTAGILILPLIRSWYDAQARLPPGPAVLVPLQLVRGALFVAFLLPLLRSMSAKRWQASLAMAILVPLVHGIANLIPSNPFMPDFVRHAHMIEIGWSTFVLGWLIGFLFWNPGPGVTQAPQD